MESTVKLYSLNYSETRTYLTALIFVAGNVVLPQLFHLFHQEERHGFLFTSLLSLEPTNTDGKPDCSQL